ncbi:MAG: Ig-like domain-containing protein [Nitriliruptorales bacterium]
MARQAIVKGWKWGRPRIRTIVIAALFALMAALASAQAATNDTTLISRASDTAGGAASNDHSGGVSVSADGRYVAFMSNADNLSVEDNDAYTTVYVRDRDTGTTTLVSRAYEATAKANDDSLYPSISADGRYVAFVSRATNLISTNIPDSALCQDLAEWYTGQDKPCSHIFVRDLYEGTTTLVSRASRTPTGAEEDAANGGSYAPSISVDGGRVAFISIADNLSADDVNVCYNTEGLEYPCANIFMHDLSTGATTYMAPGNGQFGPPNLPCGTAISADGHFIAFDSQAQLDPGDINGFGDIVVAEVSTGKLTYASRADGLNGAIADWRGIFGSTCPSISSDGRYVAFESDVSNLSDQDIDTWSSVDNDVFVRDLLEGRTTYVSRVSGATGAPANRPSSEASISGDGRYVAFSSPATNLSESDNDSADDVFVREWQSAIPTTTLVTRASGAAGAGGDSSSEGPSTSGDGSVVAFSSYADNLSDQDNNAYSNAFVRELATDGTSTPPRDTEAPETTITSGPSKLTRDNAAGFAFTSSEAGSSFMCSLDAGRSGYCTSPHQVGPLVDGSHTFRVWASDAAGNVDQTAAEYAWTIDTTAPTVVSVSPASGSVGVARSVNVTASLSEPMEPTTITTSTVTIWKIPNTGTPVLVAAAVRCGSPCNFITLDPSSSLARNTSYEVRIKGGTNGVKDLAGNPLTADYVSSFKTAK